MIADSSLVNRSLTEDDMKSTSGDQLLTVIKYLRKEKDISIAKVDILKSENVRLQTEAGILQKKLSEAHEKIVITQPPEVNAVSAAKHEEILRKVETLNAITDSNRMLREEREMLTTRNTELNARISKMEDDLFPLQENIRQLSAKSDELAAENQSLRKTSEQWHKRATSLVERSNKNPEDFKRLQNERENLAKMLTAEKETLRQLNDELNAIKGDKLRLDGELATAQKQCQAYVDEKKKISDDLTSLRQLNVRMTHEIMELKNSILQKEDEIKQNTEDLAGKEAQLVDLKNKETQIRKIAKRYKDSYFELKTKIDAQEADMAARPLADQVAAGAEQSAAATARAEAERAQAARLDELTAQMAALQDEIEQLRKENDGLKKTDDKNLLNEARSHIKALNDTNAQITREYQSSKSQLQTCEQSRTEHDLLIAGLKSQNEARVSRLEKELAEQDAGTKETIARITRENETLNLRVNQLHRQLQQQGSKPSTSSVTAEKNPSDAARTANVKPMAGPSVQQSATVNPRRGGDTPLASIRPMSVQNSRTAAVLPTSQTSNIAAIQGSSSSSSSSTSVTALVPPQQQVHTTGQSSSSSSSAEAMSSSPTSSHTDYMPATSSAVVVAVPPMGAVPAESSQEAESAPIINTNESNVAQVVVQQQAVALVSPRVEVSPQNILAPPQQSPHLIADQNQAASTSSGASGSGTTTSSSSSVVMSTHQQASSSSTVTTTQAGHKRPRDSEGDSSTGVEDSSTSVTSDAKTSPKNKRTRLGEQTFQGVSESGLDVEYQVPTSSQRDQEDDNVIVVDSEEEDEDDGMADEGTTEHFEDEADNGESYEMEESYDQEQDDEGEGPDIDEDNVQHDTNEVEVDDSSDAPNQSSVATTVAGSDVGTSAEQTIGTSPQSHETQQIQTISSGSEARSSTSWHADARQSSQLIIQQAFEEAGDDSIVPSTPTLYAPRRADG